VDIWHSVILDELNDDKFEKLVKWYFDQVGATETIIPSKNYADKVGDVDVIATFENIKTIINVQVNSIGERLQIGQYAKLRIFQNQKKICLMGIVDNIGWFLLRIHFQKKVTTKLKIITFY
jgi:Holliday junction resolvase-like predicted endonuclease